MRFDVLRRSGMAIIAASAFLVAASSASAGGLYEEHVYSDSFGNLVIHDPGGYKRIVVGKGHLAADSSYGAGAPKIVYLEEKDGRLYLRRAGRCRHGVLLHGRSYMYGLPDDVVPVPVAACGR